MTNGRTDIKRNIRHSIILLSLIIFHSLAENSQIKKSRLRCNPHRHKNMATESDSDGIFIWSGSPQIKFKVAQNTSIRLNCRDVRYTTIEGIVRRSPPVLFKWRKDNSDVTKTNHNLTPFGCKLRPPIMNPRLLVENVQIEDIGSYSCHLIRADTNEEVLRRDFQVRVEHDTFNYRPWLMIGIVLLVLPTLIAGVYFCYEKKRNKQKKRDKKYVGHGMYIVPQRESLDRDCLKINDRNPWSPTIRWEEIIRDCNELLTIASLDLKTVKQKELSRDRLECIRKDNKPEVLGSGFFGHVYKGVLKCDSKPDVQVAVKVLKDRFRYEDLYHFIEEATTLIKAGSHENLITLVGTCLLDSISLEKSVEIVNSPLIVMELAAGGSLRSFLLQYRELSTSDVSSPYSSYCGEVETEKLHSFSLQVAKGMEYLCAKNIIHRDLAARNVLLTSDQVVKIGDFGLSKHVLNKGYYRIRSRWEKPVKWTPPEALVEDRYTVQSDVWSYGVLIWEIFTLGEDPYPTIPPSNLYRVLLEGLRLNKPYLASEKIYNLMLSCWSWSPENRPSFAEISKQLSGDLSPMASTSTESGFQFNESTELDVFTPLQFLQSPTPLFNDERPTLTAEQNEEKVQKTMEDISCSEKTLKTRVPSSERNAKPPAITFNKPVHTSLHKCLSDGLIFQNHAYFNINQAYSSQITLPQGSDGESLPTTPTSVYNVNQSSSSGDYCFYDEAVKVNSKAIRPRYNDIC